MKLPALSILLLLAQPAAAQIYADFTIDDGTATTKKFTIELGWQNGYTPRAVANFISLAEGTRLWVDEATGETRTETPFYTGMKIHRAVHENAGFKVRSGISIGSPSQSGVDGPGYIYQDELGGWLNPSTSISNTVYLETKSQDLTLKQSNSSGSRLFISSLFHTEPLTNLVPIGVVLQFTPPMFPDPQQTSRLNVLSFSQVPTDGSDVPLADLTITDVSIRRVGLPNSPAVLFNALDEDWGLPEVGASAPFIAKEGNTHFLRFSANPRTEGFYYSSTDAAIWQGPFTVFQAPDDPVLGVDLTDVMAVDPKRFFRGSAIAYPSTPAADKPLPDAKYRVFLTSPTLDSRIYDFIFNATGDGGTWCELNTSNFTCSDSGNLTLVDFTVESAFTSEIFLSGDGGMPNFFFRFQHDRDTITGQPLVQSRLQGTEWEIMDFGSFQFRAAVAGTGLLETANNVWQYFAAP